MRIIIEIDERKQVAVQTVGEPSAEDALDAGPPPEELLSSIGYAETDRELTAAGGPARSEQDAGGPPHWLKQVIEGSGGYT